MDDREASRCTSAHLESVIRDTEGEIARLRATQMAAVNELRIRQHDTAVGCRSMEEWVAGRADVAPETAATLVRTAWALNARPRVRLAVADGEISYDRAVALTTDGNDLDEDAEGDLCLHLDIGGLRKRTAMRRRMTRHDEHRAFGDRYLSFQPTLDGASGRLHGQLPGMAYRVVEKAIHERGDEFPQSPGGYRRSQRNADALVAMAEDSLERRRGDDRPSTIGPDVSIFVDATEPEIPAAAAVEYGPMVGPAALEMVLCIGSVRVVGIAGGRPVTASATSRAIPPAIRTFVASRDGGCTADGCTSRYRLQPHHIDPYRRSRSHDPDNLTTLCWYHHHVVIHGSGFHIDPDSAAHRIRFTRHRSPP